MNRSQFRRWEKHETLFHRHPRNPILSAADWPYAVNSVFNPGAIRLKDGVTLLLCRVEDRRGHSHFCAATSDNGVDGWRIDPHPTLLPDPERFAEEMWGIEDARLTYLRELDQYAVAYTAYSHAGPCVALALTPDFRTYERLGVVMSPDDKDAALLPHRIDGRWLLIHRPASTMGAHIWLSYSPDLRHWGEDRMLLEARRGAWWDAFKIGLSPPLIETPDGWLMLYHGVRVSVAGGLYRLGMALFDATLQRCLLRGDHWVFGPEVPYERFGDVGNVVFPCGYTIGQDGDSLFLYYGAADTNVSLATASIRELVAWLKASGSPPPPIAATERMMS